MTIQKPTTLIDLSKPELTKLQNLLSQLHFYPNDLVDGSYGPLTQMAWQKFKQSQCLKDYELIGPSSYSRLVNLAAGQVKTAIDWTNSACKVSKHFTVFEVTQGDPRRIPHDREIQKNILCMARELDRVREAWDSPITVTSWYRPPEVNKAVGGASQSQHLTGKAVDVFPINGQLLKFQGWLDHVAWADKALGYGAKKGFVHLDLRPGRIRWNY